MVEPTEAEVRALLAAEAKATPGPWRHGPESHGVQVSGNGCTRGFRVSCESGIGDHSSDVGLIVTARNLAAPLASSWLAMREREAELSMAAHEVAEAIDHYFRRRDGWVNVAAELATTLLPRLRAALAAKEPGCE